METKAGRDREKERERERERREERVTTSKQKIKTQRASLQIKRKGTPVTSRPSSAKGLFA